MSGIHSLVWIKVSTIMAAFLLIAILPSPLDAEVTVDGTIKTPHVAPVNITPTDGEYAITADLGQVSGANLFHSFSTFNIGAWEAATFSGPSTITNIISRVTGGPSSIEGTIRSTILGANFYLMNPYGVVFGPNAFLDVTGSFRVTTADYLKFLNGDRVYADPGRTNMVLSTAPVSAFGFLTCAPVPISSTDSFLFVPDGQTLSIIGGDLQLGVSDPYAAVSVIAAGGGQINLASVASPGEVVISQPGEPPPLAVDSFNGLGNMNLQNIIMDVTDMSGLAGSGTVLIRGGKLTLDGCSVYAATVGSVKGNEVGIDINVIGEVKLTNASQLITQTVRQGDASAIRLQAGTLTLENFSVINGSSVQEAAESGGR